MDKVVIEEEDNSFETCFKKAAEKLGYNYPDNLLDKKQDQFFEPEGMKGSSTIL